MTLVSTRSEVARRADRNSRADEHAQECAERTERIATGDTTGDRSTNGLP